MFELSDKNDNTGGEKAPRSHEGTTDDTTPRQHTNSTSGTVAC